ncbi:MAG: hypothetical protein SFZ24_01270 [Planctomycetota bacterium]|nr:hypothetical protein [Planctomycetota bacterium]
MRIQDVPYFQGLTPTERNQLLFEAIRQQGEEIRTIVGDLFTGVANQAAETVRPLNYWAQIARENQAAPAVTPLNYWENLEAQRRRNNQIDRESTNPLLLGATNDQASQPTRLRPGLGTGLTPVEFAQGKRSDTPLAVRVGVPAPPPIRTVTYQDIVQTRSQVTSAIGRIIDVVA